MSWAEEVLAEPPESRDTADQVILLAILAELRELNTRLARAEVMASGLMTGKSAKWITLFAKTSGFGG